MKTIWRMILLFLPLFVMLTGCSLWMDGDYVSVTPNHSYGDSHTEGVVFVSSYQQICVVLAEMVEDGMQEGVLHVSGMSDSQIDYYINASIDYVLRTNPIGAYAVNQITYDIGTSMGKPAVALDITYNHNRSEILRIKRAQDMEDVFSLIRLALDNCEAGTVLRVKNYRYQDLVQFVQDYVNQNPHKCMELPQVTVSHFPELGQERVIEITFSYQTSRQTLRTMQQSVGDIFQSARLYIDPGADNSEKYAQLYTFLMERYDYKYETSITPAYSLLRHGVGDSKAFATVYAAMCRQVDLDCQVVSGTRAGEAWHWNVFKDGDQYYHIDLLKCSANGRYLVKSEEQMTGYVWDYSAF